MVQGREGEKDNVRCSSNFGASWEENHVRNVPRLSQNAPELPRYRAAPAGPVALGPLGNRLEELPARMTPYKAVTWQMKGRRRTLKRRPDCQWRPVFRDEGVEKIGERSFLFRFFCESFSGH